jgi:hypothetical protein
MGEHRMVPILIGLGLMTVIVGIFINAMADATEKNSGIDFDNATIQRYYKLQQFEQEVKKIKENEENSTTEAGILDVLGDLLKGGYIQIRRTKETVGMAKDLTNAAVEDIDIGPNGRIFQVFIISCITIIIIIGILARILTKQNP